MESLRTVWTRLLFGIGMGGVLVVGSLVGVRWATADVPTPPPNTAPTAMAQVVCFGHVDAEVGVTALRPAVAGRVVRVAVSEGKTLAAGAEVLTLDDTQAQLVLAEAHAGLQVAQLQREQAKQLPAQHKLKIRQQTAAITAAKARIAAAEQNVERQRRLLNAGSLNQAELQGAMALVTEAQSAARAEEARLEELQLLNPEQKEQEAAAQVKLLQAKVDQAQHGLRELTLYAPSAGTVLRVLATPGELVGPMQPQPVVVFAPTEVPLIVRAELDQEFVWQVKTGHKVQIQDDAGLNPTRWTGTVQRVSDWIARRRSILLEPGQLNDARTAECIIKLDAGTPPVRIGQRMRVTIRTGE
jgi:multidrug resistance efflux pump